MSALPLKADIAQPTCHGPSVPRLMQCRQIPELAMDSGGLPIGGSTGYGDGSSEGEACLRSASVMPCAATPAMIAT
jgi:hypothetical protein